MSGISEVAKDVGLNPIKLDSGTVVDTSELLTAFFDEIASRCAAGEKVRINGFGTFAVTKYKGRTVKSPVVGECSFGDTLVLKFKQSTSSKTTMNVDGAVEAFDKAVAGGKDEKPKVAKPKKDKKSKKKTDSHPDKVKKNSKKKTTKDIAKKKSKKKSAEAAD